MQTTQQDLNASARITAEVTSWPGVTAGPGSRGEWAFRVGRREIGHLHGDHVAHFGFPKAVFDDYFAQGRITHHPVFPGRRGPGARRIGDDRDVADVIAILREQYERALSPSSPAGSAAPPAAPSPPGSRATTRST